ncbi:leucine zipper transcription factor-like protein 1 [Watersipora subatra]|uniref:leucine zipper transcription factor-like protein 1 n=1 Tax=Watersipora subatra TaxID=2589382 RepID=UPI00355BDAFC
MSGTGALGLNDHHQATVVNYMRFAKYQRGQRLRCVDACFEDLKSSRLFENTYTADEVTEMLDGLLVVVRGEVDDELLNTSHTNVLLMRQLFQQAEKWHLKLQADISELENRELLEKIKNFEEAEFTGTSRDSDLSNLTTKLEPLNDSGTSALLSMKIQDLEEENERLRSKLGSVEKQAIGISEEKSQLLSQLRSKEGELSAAVNKTANYDSREVEDLQKQLQKLKGAMEGDAGQAKSKATELQSNLISSKHELLKVQEMLEMANMELEKKVSQTTQFKNLKQMLQKKNEQMKDLRRRLGKYEGLDD